MSKLNPYQSPKTGPESVPTFKPRFDAGKITGRYFQTLGAISVLSMLAGPIFFDHFNLDISALVLLGAAECLIRHSPAARNWTLVICWLNLVVILFMIFAVLVFGTGNMTLTIGQTIQNPPVLYVIFFAAGLAVLPAIPAWLLMTPEAKIEFGVKKNKLP